ncbi:MAG: Gfo/Idh/MocA family oxidoreductase, partial [bacterium]|nr:Gfo/Idh/MocA family oxidoreductase [bacterium]
MEIPVTAFGGIPQDAVEKLTPVRFAVAGCGNIGTRHMAVLNAEPNAKLSGFCEINTAKFKTMEDLYHVPGFVRYADLLAHTDAEVINICTPHALHAPMAINAARAKKHILVEKPMTLSSEDGA